MTWFMMFLRAVQARCTIIFINIRCAYNIGIWYITILYTHGAKFLINIIQNMFGEGRAVCRLKDLKD